MYGCLQSAREICIWQLVSAFYTHMPCSSYVDAASQSIAATSWVMDKIQSPAALNLFQSNMAVAREMSSLEPSGQRKASQVGNQQGA